MEIFNNSSNGINKFLAIWNKTLQKFEPRKRKNGEKWGKNFSCVGKMCYSWTKTWLMLTANTHWPSTFAMWLKLNSKISVVKYKKNSQKAEIPWGVLLQNLKGKGSISPSNSDGQLPNILFTYLCLRLCVKVHRVVAVA